MRTGLPLRSSASLLQFAFLFKLKSAALTRAVSASHRIQRLTGAPTRRVNLGVTLVLAAAAAVFLAMLIVPGRILSTQSTGDLWLFLDGADRLINGQRPNVDFSSPIGPLTYALLAGGYGMGGTIGTMMPITTALFALLLLVPLVYVLATRLPPLFALVVGLYILLLAIAPAFIGDVAPKPTFAMFYNRFGWAAISLLFLCLLPRHPKTGSDWADALAMAFLWLLLFYIKTTYAVVGAAFLVALLWFPHMRGTVLGTAAAAAMGMLIVEAFWGGTAAYIRDVQDAVAATGALRDGPAGLIASIINNIQGVYLFAAVILLALLNRVRLDFLLLCLFMGAAGIVLDRHNSQGPGILTFVPGALIALLAPRTGRVGDQVSKPSLAGSLLAAALIVPVLTGSLGNLAYHFLVAARSGPQPGDGTPLAGLIATEPGSSSLHAIIRTPQLATGCGPLDRAAPLLETVREEHPMGSAQTLAVLLDGVRLIRDDPRLNGKVLSLDAVNPYNAVLERPAPEGVYSFMDADINMSETIHRSPKTLFRQVDVVLVPIFPAKYPAFDLVRRLYGPYISAHFEPVARSQCWDAYRRKPAGPALAKSA